MKTILRKKGKQVASFNFEDIELRVAGILVDTSPQKYSDVEIGMIAHEIVEEDMRKKYIPTASDVTFFENNSVLRRFHKLNDRQKQTNHALEYGYNLKRIKK